MLNDEYPELRIFWVEGIENSDLLITDHNLDKIDQTLSLKRWAVVEDNTITVNGKQHKMLAMTPEGNIWRVSVADKDYIDKLNLLLTEEEDRNKEEAK